MIRTQRLHIGALVPADAPVLFRYRADARVARFQSWMPDSVEDAETFIKVVALTPFDQAGTWSQLAVRSAETGELVGDLGVHFLEDRQVEFGVSLAPAHQRRGFAREALTGLFGYLFDTLDKHRIFASVDPRNAASMALMNSLGMRQEAHFHQSMWWKGEWVDDVVFGILQAEWRAGN